MLDESNAPLPTEEPAAPEPPDESGNRTFLIIGGIFAALIFLTLVIMALWFFVLGPKFTAQRNLALSETQTANAQAIQNLTATAQAAAASLTPLPSATPTLMNTPVPNTPTATETPVLAMNSPLPTPTIDATGTAVAAETQLAAGTMTVAAMNLTPLASPTAAATAMPKTGFFDQVGLPSLIILAVALLVVIFVARRMRRAPQ